MITEEDLTPGSMFHGYILSEWYIEIISIYKEGNDTWVERKEWKPTENKPDKTSKRLICTVLKLLNNNKFRKISSIDDVELEIVY